MAILVKGGRAAKFLKKLALPTAVMGTATGVGAVAYGEAAQPGLKFQAIKEGAVAGALGGASLVLAPKVGGVLARHGATKAAAAARNVSKKGKVVFRRVRGRIIPIRVK